MAGPKLPEGMIMGPDGKAEWIPGYLEGRERLLFAGKSQPRTPSKAASGKVASGAPSSLPKEYDKVFQREEAKRLSKQLENRPLGLDTINATAKASELLKQGIYTGSLANYQKDAAKVASKLNLMSPDKAARTEEFIAYIGNVVIPGLKDFGGSDTVEELNYLKEVSAGKISLEPKAMEKILQNIEAKTRRRLQEVDKAAGTSTPLPTTQSLNPLSPQQVAPPVGGQAPQAPVVSGAPAAAAAPSAKPLSQQEKDELARLRKKYGR